MSIRFVAAVLDHLPELNATETLILVALADYTSDDTRECWPKVETIARRARCDRRTVQRRLRGLEAMGLIDIAIGGHQYGHNAASRYRLKFNYAGQIVPDVAEPGVIHKGGTAPPLGRRSEQTRAAMGADKGGNNAAPSVIDPSLNLRGAKAPSEKQIQQARAAAALTDDELEERARTGKLTAAEEHEREHRRRMRPRRVAS